eukprot:Nk52_evm4s2630 gene=Nk52_evmTU4s2630
MSPLPSTGEDNNDQTSSSVKSTTTSAGRREEEPGAGKAIEGGVEGREQELDCSIENGELVKAGVYLEEGGKEEKTERSKDGEGEEVEEVLNVGAEKPQPYQTPSVSLAQLNASCVDANKDDCVVGADEVRGSLDALLRSGDSKRSISGSAVNRSLILEESDSHMSSRALSLTGGQMGAVDSVTGGSLKGSNNSMASLTVGGGEDRSGEERSGELTGTEGHNGQGKGAETESGIGEEDIYDDNEGGESELEEDGNEIFEYSDSEDSIIDAVEVAGLSLRENRWSIASGLSNLGVSADGKKTVYLNASLSGFFLSNCEGISSYIHLQELDLSNNELTDLRPLSSMQHLLKLNASHNRLTKLLDFTPPLNLIEADFSNNCLVEIADLSAHVFLEKLCLDKNAITKIEGLDQCKRLNTLSLKRNEISKIENLTGLPLERLVLRRNKIRKIQNLETLHNLVSLDLSKNRISSLKGLQGHDYLQKINLEGNKVIDITQVRYVKNLRLLRDLNLSKNDVQSLEDYRSTLLFKLPRLTMLDRQEATAEQKVAAVNQFNPPPEIIASKFHSQQVMNDVRQQAKVRVSTPASEELDFRPIVFVGPVGVGKRTLRKKLLGDYPDIYGMVISHTSRPPNEREVDHVDYHFTTREQMEEDIEQGKFVESVSYFNNYYGISIMAIEEVARSSKICVMDMELEGVLTMKKTHFNPRYILVYPNSARDYESRLLKRSNNNIPTSSTLQILKDRNAQYELYARQKGFFDAVIINDDLEEAYQNLLDVVKDDIRAIKERNQTKSRPISRSRTKVFSKGKMGVCSRPVSVKEHAATEG